MSEEHIVHLSPGLRAGQKEHTARYRDAAGQSLVTQRVAIDLQRRGATVYRIVISVAALSVTAFAIYLYPLPI